MPATSTYRQVLNRIVEQYGLGRVIPVTSNTTTTFTLTTTGSPELRGPFTGLGIPNGAPIVCTVETTGASALGNRTFANGWVPSTGVLTVTPAIGDTDVTEIVVLNVSAEDADRLLEAISRAHENHVGRWELRPLTFVPDGDLQGTTVTDYWTAAANGTASYVAAQVFPAGSAADAVGQVGLNRVLQLVSAGGSTSVDSNGIRVVPTTQGLAWYFLTAIRLSAGAGTVTFSVRDNTNAANITTQVIRGNSSNTLTTTRFGDFMILEGTFNLPTTCDEISFRLALSATGITAQMAPLITFPQNASRYPLPNRIRSIDDIGNFYCPVFTSSPAGFMDADLGEPITTYGREHRLHDFGDHRAVSFNFRPSQAVFYEEHVYGSAFSAMTDTTTFPLDRLVKWSYFEFADNMMRREMGAGARNDSGGLLPSVWRPIRNAAYYEAAFSPYEPPLKKVVGRRG